MQELAFWIILGQIALALLLSWAYCRRYQVARPPIGVLNLGDMAFIVGSIVVTPYLYLILPNWLVVALLVTGVGSVLYFAWEPVLRARWATWLITVIMIAADAGAMLRFGTTSAAFLALNNVVLVAFIVGATALWAQGGMCARDAALLGSALMVYDFLFTTQMPVMSDMFARLANMPFMPMIAWPVGSGGEWLGIGLGDVLLASAFPVVMRKAFGRPAGITAMALAAAALAGALLLPVAQVFPVMVVLGPLMVVQYLYWRRGRGRERTTREYLQAEPVRNARV